MSAFRVLQAAAIALALSSACARAEVKKFAYLCGNGDPVRICPYFQLVLTPPDGWMIEKAATAQNRVQMLVPKGKDFNNAPALIYVQVFYHRDKEQSLEDFAKASNESWLADVKDAKITPLPPVERANGKPGFLRFAFDNPSNKQQAFEIGSFGIDNDTDGNEFVLDVVITGRSKRDIEGADKDYAAFLKTH